MRLSRRSRNSVKHKSASVEFADQTGGRILTIRLEFNYKNRPKLLEARYTILRLFFMGLAKSLSFVGGFPRLSGTAGPTSGRWL